MSTSQTISPCVQKLDPLKRVNYTFGMVLGVDEFRQEQTYLIEKDHSQYRLLHGYGTACGLQVRIDTTPDLEVKVSKGVAINPQGQEIHVCQEMCARLNDWLTGNQSALHSIFGAPPFSMSLCVVLCYRECATDLVPVPGEPCRSQQDAMAAAHIAESFQIKLCLDEDRVITSPPASPPLDPSVLGLCFRPSQVEEDTIRHFGRLLARIRITDAGPSSITRLQLENLVRELGPGQHAPLTSPPLSSPPDDSSPIYLSTSDAREFLRDAFRVWVTEVRPSLTDAPGCGCGTPSEQCVLLAELHFNVAKGWQVSGTVTVDESRRPYLLETRLLQECLLNGGTGSPTGGVGGGTGAAVVAAGTFSISGNNAIPLGPVFNDLTVAPGGQPGTFVLDWSGFPAYVNPLTSSPANHTYVVKGTAVAGAPASAPYAFQVLAFQNNGILIAAQGVKGVPAAGFMVEISEITGV